MKKSCKGCGYEETLLEAIKNEEFGGVIFPCVVCRTFPLEERPDNYTSKESEK